jgi:parallel beta-helix repeat protein
MAGAGGARLHGLEVSDNQFAGILTVDAVSPRIVGSSISGNGPGKEGVGIILFGSHDARIAGNAIFGNGDTGIFVGDSLSSAIGILVESTATGTVVERNIASGNADDSIEVDSPATTLAANVADRDGDLGIEAIAGVIDGGRNRAAGNGAPAQCENVACG